MDETTHPPAELSWVAGAVEPVMAAFTAYANARLRTGDLDECRREAGVSEATAALFEEVVDEFFPDQDDEDGDDEAGESAAGAA